MSEKRGEAENLYALKDMKKVTWDEKTGEWVWPTSRSFLQELEPLVAIAESEEPQIKKFFPKLEWVYNFNFWLCTESEDKNL